ncbi:MAG: hypothetical protein ACXABY_13405 [Candidatus Thorarchaeota archaeon]|jgi:hypothetical protein
MNIQKIKEIQEAYQRTKQHSVIQETSNLNAAQTYAISHLGLKKGVPPQVLADHMDNIKDGMSIGEIAVALGYSAQFTLD